LVVFLVFELLVSQVMRVVSRHAVSQSLHVMTAAVARARSDLAESHAKRDTLLAEVSELQARLDTADDAPIDDTEKVSPAKAERRGLILGIIAQEPSISYPDLAQRLGVSLPTVKRDMAELLDTGKVRRNGHGLEVVNLDTLAVSSVPVSAATN